MHLIVSIEHGGFGIFSHSGSTHLVDAVAHLVLVVKVHYIFQSRTIEHFLCINLDLLVELKFVGSPFCINAECRLAPLVEHVFVEGHLVVMIWKTLSKSGDEKLPAARLHQPIFEVSAETLLIGTGTPARSPSTAL